MNKPSFRRWGGTEEERTNFIGNFEVLSNLTRTRSEKLSRVVSWVILYSWNRRLGQKDDEDELERKGRNGPFPSCPPCTEA
jgi:hypothetical protein